MRTIYIDTETTGLNPKTDRLAVFQFQINDFMPQLVQNPDLAKVHALLDSADVLVGHNLAFDFAFLRYDPRDYTRFDDTLYLSRLADYEKEGHSLDIVATRVLGEDPYKDFEKSRLQRTKWDQALTEEQKAYALTDIQVLPAIYARFKRHINNPIYKFDKRSILAGLRTQQHGLPVLHHAVGLEINTVKQERDQLLGQLPCNPNSPKQVKEQLGTASSDDRTLAELQAEGNEIAAKVRACRSAIKYLNFLEKLNAADRYYGTLQPAARSGRFTSKQHNLQQLPRNTKRFIGSPDNVIVAADFAQLELRTIAAITKDETMIELFRNGEDLHNYSAAQLFGPDYTKTQRQIAKVFNFATLYGSGAATIGLVLLTQTGIALPEFELQLLKKKWLLTFKGVAQWQREGSQRHGLNQPWRTPHGRPYTSARYTDHLSIENQGAGAEVARIALHYLDDHLLPEALLVNFVHDSYVIECPNNPVVYKDTAKTLQAAMKRGWDKAPFNKHGIEMPVEVGVAHNWKDADALENCIYTLEDTQ